MIVFGGNLLNAHGPEGDRALGTLRIANVATYDSRPGSGERDLGDYRVTLKPQGNGQLRQAEVVGFPRKKAGAWELLRRALDALAENRELP